MVWIGDAGGIGIDAEITYGTAGAAPTWLHPQSATLGLRKSLLAPNVLRTSAPTARSYSIHYCDGDAVVGHNASRAVNGDLYASFGALSTDTYTFGDGTAPDENSVSIWTDTGGHQMVHVGCKGSELRFEFNPDEMVKVVSTWIGQNSTSETPVAVSNPAESGIMMDSDLGTITVGGTAFCILSAVIGVAIPVVDTSRHCLGGTTIKEPERIGPPIVSGTLQCEFGDDTGADSAAVYDLFIAGTALGDIVIDDWTAAAAYMTGESPVVQSGITGFTVAFEATSIALVTTA